MTWELASSGSRAARALSAVLQAHGAPHTASTSGGWAVIVLAVAVFAGRWAWHAWRHPYGPCWRCQGGGRNPGSSRERFGDCRRCGGSGRQVRTGARLVHKGIERGRRR